MPRADEGPAMGRNTCSTCTKPVWTRSKSGRRSWGPTESASGTISVRSRFRESFFAWYRLTKWCTQNVPLSPFDQQSCAQMLCHFSPVSPKPRVAICSHARTGVKYRALLALAIKHHRPSCTTAPPTFYAMPSPHDMLTADGSPSVLADGAASPSSNSRDVRAASPSGTSREKQSGDHQTVTHMVRADLSSRATLLI